MTIDEKLRVVQTLTGILIESKNNLTVLGSAEKAAIQGKLIEIISSFDTGIYASKYSENTAVCESKELKMESVVDGATL